MSEAGYGRRARRALKPSAQPGMPAWQDRLFIWLALSEPRDRLL